MKALFTFSISIVLSVVCLAQTKLPYTANFDNVAQQAEWKHYKLGQEVGPYEWEFERINNIADSIALSHYYPVGGTQVTDDWMVSPELDMSKGAIIDSMFHLMKGFGGVTPQIDDTIALYYLEGNRDPSLASKKEIVYDFLRTDFKLDNIWYSKSALKIPYKASSGYLAFRYKTIVNWLDIKVDNIQVAPQKDSENPSDSSKTVIDYPSSSDTNMNLTIYPNPSKSIIRIRADISGPFGVSIHDFTGKLVLEEIVSSNSELHVEHLPKGLYIVEVSSQNQIQKTKLKLE